MPGLRHLAEWVGDPDKAGEFYWSVFDLKRTDREDMEIRPTIHISDVINLTWLNFKDGQRTKASYLKATEKFESAHHFGFQVNGLDKTQKRIETNARKYCFDLGDKREGNFERKFKDPNGIIFDISEHGRHGTDGYLTTKNLRPRRPA